MSKSRITTITGKIDIHSEARINYVIKTSDYVFVSEGIFKLKVQDDKIISLSMYIKPNLEQSYIASDSKIACTKKGDIDFEKSTLVKPSIGIQDDFYIWGENISVSHGAQGVGSLVAKARVGLGASITVPVEKRKHITSEFLKKYLGCDDAGFAKFILPLMDSKQMVASTGKHPFCAESQTICGFGLEKNEMHMKARKCKLTLEEEALLEESQNLAKIKLEENENAKIARHEKTHRDSAKEYAEFLMKQQNSQSSPKLK